ncbi:MAG: AAA family ATPase [Ruminococcus sp.]|nr:AAA family ATPase [Ruminococcus sp.]
MNAINLSEEQQNFVDYALKGQNILVNACIGSGKTTAIQLLCNKLPKSKRILYLTYNRLLKLDAQAKIKNSNAKVQNYHGIAWYYLHKINISAGVGDLITRFNEVKPPIDHYDVLIIDEYQDIETELSLLLEYVKSTNPRMQIIAVGDMQQKIYDKTNLNVADFINQFLGEHLELEFTQCFRLSAELAEKLGRIWCKKIKGVNSNCVVEEMNMSQIVDFLSTQRPQDILCLGSRNGDLSKTLNTLEQEYPATFNKRTVYASISDNDSIGSAHPTPDTAIFTTFDSSKGLERNVCVIFDYTESYWQVRISKPQQSYEILRNIFCVAASRGKSRIIFVNSGEEMLSEATLSTRVDENQNLSDVDIASMFDFKYREDIENCFSLLQTKPIVSEDRNVIEVKSTDGMIDLSPCIGIYQEAMFFDNYEIDKAIEMYISLHDNKETLWTNKVKQSSLEHKILFLVSLETNQDRYRTQVDLPFVNEEAANLIADRLFTRLQHNENAQVGCRIPFSDKKDGNQLFIAGGFADVVKDGIVYELKFVSELSHEHFLQCACYIVALKLEKGILWNTRDNTAYEVRVPDKKKFLDAVANAITKNKITAYFEPSAIKPKPIVVQAGHSKLTTVAASKNEILKYTVGARVKHISFGEGTILKVSPYNGSHLIEVKFEKGGVRKLLLEIVLGNKMLGLTLDDSVANGFT